MRRKFMVAAVGLCGFLLTMPGLAGASSLSTTTRITPGINRHGANGRFYMGNTHTLSRDGRITVFATQSTNQVPNDTNGFSDIFVYDKASDTTELISKGPQGQLANGENLYPSVSADGMYIAYLSSATNILPGVKTGCPAPGQSANQCGMVLVYNRITKQHIVAGRADNGAILPTYYYDSPVISGDGKSVAFATRIPTPGGVTENIFLRNLQTNTTQLVSVDNVGNPLRTFGGEPSLSYDGQLVTFTTAAPGVVQDTNEVNDVYLRDIAAGTTKLLSAKAGGVASGNSSSSGGVISSNGAFVAYHSFSSDLVANDNDIRGYRDVFLHDLTTGSTRRISVSNNGTEGNFGSYDPDISDDGRFVVYTSEANNIVPADTNNRPDIMFYDRFAGITRRVNVGSHDGVQADHESDTASISGDGKTVVFKSRAHNLYIPIRVISSVNLFQVYNPVADIPYYDPSSIIDLFGTAR